ncbi:hypothetical protein WDU94_013539 [Cyamophila willieti]
MMIMHCYCNKESKDFDEYNTFLIKGPPWLCAYHTSLVRGGPRDQIPYGGMTGAASEVPALWDMDSADYYECDCPGPPPPEFRLPRPPQPPPEFLNAVIGGVTEPDCSESNTLADDLLYCDKPVSSYT